MNQQHGKSNQNPNRLYDRIRVLGQGSFGVASVNRRRQDCWLVVLKEIDLSRYKGENERLSAINEAAIMSNLRHSNIIEYYNSYATDTKLIIEMEYASVGTLANYLSLHSPLAEREILVIFKQITNGLRYLHSKSIIHLDLKMENIFLTREGLVKIGDFGIAHCLEPSELNSAGIDSNKSKQQTDTQSTSSKLKKSPQISPLHCTLAFSSPERCLGQPTDFKSDIWSLGCILYELITSKPLFNADSMPQIMFNITRITYQPIKQDISSALKQTFESMIEKDPKDRPTAHELHCIMSHLLSHHGQNNPCKDGYSSRQDRKRQFRRTSGGHQLNYQRQRYLTDISSEMAWRAEQDEDQYQLLYHYSLVYQVRLDSQNIQLSRVRTPRRRIREISKGESHYLVLTYDSIVYGWGSQSEGQLGACGLTKSGANSSQPESSSQENHSSLKGRLQNLPPTSSPFIMNELNHRNIVQVAAGKNFSVFLSKTGIVMTCGDGSRGCLGIDEIVSSYKPIMIESLFNYDVTFIASGPKHVIAVCGDGRVFAWGKNSHGRLGVGSSLDGSEYVKKPHLVQFPARVSIRRAYCGDKSTVFVDSRNRCWACGQNRFNKLGLDMPRRFKKTSIVEHALVPQEIESLNKTNIISCSIAKNHSTFLTDGGRLIVFGQDIDHGFKVRSYMNCDHKNLARHFLSEFEAKPKPREKNSDPHSFALTAKKLDSNLMKNRIYRQRWEYYNKKCRSSRLMPFENVLDACCTKRFSLALTRDNRVYFWGTRSYKNGDPDPCSTANLSVEPELVDKRSDVFDCYVKIGPTNSSLMRSIQHLGSDQPIIHAQDPRLVADSISDLWILDYQLSLLSSSSSNSSNSSAASECPSNIDSISKSVGSHCSICYSECNFTESSNQTIDSPSKEEDWECIEEPSENRFRHDAILDPQPIVSLYVPATFNRQSSYLHLKNLFCFDDDRFYLILETTVKPPPRSRSNPNSKVRTDSKASLAKGKQNQSETGLNPGNSNYPSSQSHKAPEAKSTGAKSTQLMRRMRTIRSGSLPIGLAGNFNSERLANEQEGTKLARSAGQAEERDERSCQNEDSTEVTVEVTLKDSDSADTATIEGNGESNRAGISLPIASLDSCGIEANNVVSSFGMSLEEPRSLSTFGPNSGPQIVMGYGTTRKDLESLDLLDEEAEKRSFLKRSKHRARRTKQKSESTTGNEETSPMPSWVRNEFIEHKQEQRSKNGFAGEDEWIFKIDSSTNSEENCTGEVTGDMSRQAIDSYRAVEMKHSDHKEGGESVTKPVRAVENGTNLPPQRSRARSAGESWMRSRYRGATEDKKDLEYGAVEKSNKCDQRDPHVKLPSQPWEELDGLDLSLNSLMRLDENYHPAGKECAQFSSSSEMVGGLSFVTNPTDSNIPHPGILKTSRWRNQVTLGLSLSQTSIHSANSKPNRAVSSLSLASIKKSFIKMFC